MSSPRRFSSAERDGLERGVEALANAMKVTLGPKGRNVVLERKFGAPTVTHDGVSVAREVELMDKSDEAVKLIKEVIRKTDKEETSEQKATAEVLKEAIAKEAAKRKKT